MARGGRRKAVGLLVALGMARDDGASKRPLHRRAARAWTAVKAVKAVKKVGYVKLLLIVAVPLLAVCGVGVVVFLAFAAFIDAEVEAAAGLQQIQQACTAGGSTGAGAEAPASTGQGALPPEQIAQLAAGAGFTGGDVVTAVAVALAESEGLPDADNANSNGTVDYGLWQINSIHARAGFDVSRAYDPAYNAAWAHRIFTNAGGWSPWVVYNNDDYRDRLAEAESAAAGVDPPNLQLGSTAGSPTAVEGTLAWGGYANGRIPRTALAPIAGGHWLRPDAAAAWNALQQAATADLGHPIGVTDSYRSYASQVDLKARKGSLAATPGRSNHGWGVAVDVVTGGWDGEVMRWLEANAPRFGWHHPPWARIDGSKPEHWHWEYRGGGQADMTPVLC